MRDVWMLSLFIVGILLLKEASTKECSEKHAGGYIFLCPRQMSSGATNEMIFHRDSVLSEGVLTVTITFQENYNGNESVAVVKNYKIPAGEETSYLKLYLPKFDNYVYNGKLIINGSFPCQDVSGVVTISFSPSKDYICVIQTDRAIYKRGDIVQFRVLVVDKQLRPPSNTKVNVYVEDPNGIRMFQWNNISSSYGLSQFDFSLSEEPTLGTWRILVINKEETTTENFQVEEYVLPKYEVKIVPPPFVLINEKTIKIKVCANYTYGKPVEGIARMNVSLETYPWANDKLPVIEYETKIKGCFDYGINVSEIENGNYYYYRRIFISVSVKEFGTDVEQNSTLYIQREYNPLQISFQDSQNNFFKPGLPRNVKLQVTNPDNSPAPKERIEICYTETKERVIFDWLATKKVRHCKNFTSDEGGWIEVQIPPKNIDCLRIDIEARSLKYARDPNNNSPNSLSQPQATLTLTPYFSPSGSFIQLQPVQETLSCGSRHSLRLLFTSKTNDNFTFHYKVISQGKVVHNGTTEISFSTEQDISDQVNDECKLIDGNETILVPSTKSNPPSDEKECAAAKEIRYMPPVGQAHIEVPIGYTPSPYVIILVHYTRHDREVVADSLKIKVEKCFKNQVKLQFGDSVKQPGTKTSVRITASPHSLCGLKVVDKSSSLLKANDQITSDTVFNRLGNLDTNIFYPVNPCSEGNSQPGLQKISILPPRPWSSSVFEDSLTAFNSAGYAVISNNYVITRPCVNRDGGGYVSYDESIGAGGIVSSKVALASTARRPPNSPQQVSSGADSATKSVSDVRNNFPETWLFDLTMTGDKGEFTTKKTLPDTITTWEGDAFCLNRKDGLGISNKTSIRGFQAFFISLTLPYYVVRGEVFWISVSIFNYLKEALEIRVTFLDSEGFEIVAVPADQDSCIHPESNQNVNYKLRAKSLWEQNITIRAETTEETGNVCGDSKVSSAVARDTIRDSIYVKPEGWEREEVQSELFCLEDDENDSYNKEFVFHMPEGSVEDSARAVVDISGDVLGKPTDNLENLVTLPTGCGEQNMVKFVPNLVVLTYLVKTKQLTVEKKTRIIKNLNIGYQNQLRYRRSDGSFSAFQTDKEGSMFLTAFVLQYFYLASEYITIDKNVITQMQNWIVSKQQENGCFPNTGKILSSGIQGGIQGESANGRLTAYVLVALLLSEYTSNNTVIFSGLTCLKENEDSTSYTNLLYARAEFLAGNKDSAKERITRENERSVVNGSLEYFHDKNATQAQDIEATSYGIIGNLLVGNGPQSVLKMVKYLISKMNRNGGMISTQDTCLAIQALSSYAEITFEDPVDLVVHYSGVLEKTIHINESNKLVVDRSYITEIPSTLQVDAEGSGCAVIVTTLRYNSLTAPEKLYFDFSVTGSCGDEACKSATIAVAVRYRPEGKQTNMAIIRIQIITGYVVDTNSVEQLKQDTKLNLRKYEVENNELVCYFDEITNEQKRFSFVLSQFTEVDEYRKGQAEVLDYYRPDISAKTEYSLNGCEENVCYLNKEE